MFQAIGRSYLYKYPDQNERITLLVAALFQATILTTIKITCLINKYRIGNSAHIKKINLQLLQDIGIYHEPELGKGRGHFSRMGCSGQMYLTVAVQS